MRRCWTTALLFLLAACASRTVQFEVPAAPAVTIETASVAVIAQDRTCREVAKALIDELGRHTEFRVDPRSDVRILVFGCGVDIGWTLHHEVDYTGTDVQQVEQADLIGRGHAAISVTQDHAGLAHLVGNARDGHLGAGMRDMFRSRKAMQGRLTQSVAADLVAQLNPLPVQQDRRIYPRAPQGTARELHTLAVRAEQSGDIALAHQLATAAHAERPTARTADYLAALERRLSTAAPHLHTD